MSSQNWFIRPEPRPNARYTLVCFHHAGAGSSAFRGWPQEVPSYIEILLVQLPGRENRLREAPFLRISDLSPILVDSLMQVLDRPFAFYGHSLGAAIAFEAALRLRQIGRSQPVHLFVGASPAPQLPWEHSPLYQLPEAEFLCEMQRRYGVLPGEVLADPELRKVIVPTLRADLSMIETYTYTPQTPLSCDITAFGGVHDAMVTLPQLEAWEAQTDGCFRLRMLNGNHFFLRTCREQLMESIAEGFRFQREKHETIH